MATRQERYQRETWFAAYKRILEEYGLPPDTGPRALLEHVRDVQALALVTAMHAAEGRTTLLRDAPGDEV